MYRNSKEENTLEGRFPKRKNGSVDGIAGLSSLYQNEFEVAQRQHARELEHVSRKLEQAVKREAAEADRNVILEAEVMELNTKKSGFEKILMAQEDIIKKLNSQVKEYEGKYISLNATLAESEALNKEMTKKLQQYSDEKTSLMEEKDQLTMDINKWKNRLDLEKSKYELLKQKLLADTEETKHMNDTLMKDLASSKNELTKIKNVLNKREIEVKTLSDELHVKSQVGSTQLHLPETNDVTSSELVKKLSKEKEKCKELEKQLILLKTSQRDSGMKLLSSGQSLEQLESQLHRKSAECSALQISKNTMQNKMESLEAENKKLKEIQRLFDFNEGKLQEEISLKGEIQSKNEELLGNILIFQDEKQKLENLNGENKKEILSLKMELSTLKSQIHKYESTISQLQKQTQNIQNESEAWKNNYTKVHDKLLKVEYEKSDAAKFDLQQENTMLKIEISKTKKEFSTMINEMYEEKRQYQFKYESALRILRKEKQDLENNNADLQTNLTMTCTRLEQNDRFSSTKDFDRKRTIQEKEEILSRMFSMEEQLREAQRTCFQKDQKINFLENENRELQYNIDKLNSELLYSNKTKQYSCRERTILHGRTQSAESYYNPQLLYSISDPRMHKIERKDGDGDTLPSPDKTNKNT